MYRLGIKTYKSTNQCCSLKLLPDCLRKMRVLQASLLFKGTDFVNRKPSVRYRVTDLLSFLYKDVKITKHSDLMIIRAVSRVITCFFWLRKNPTSPLHFSKLLFKSFFFSKCLNSNSKIYLRMRAPVIVNMVNEQPITWTLLVSSLQEYWRRGRRKINEKNQ